ncbi:peptidoglycan DD-metalloendopeptidase family protein, partial [uncultured Methylobacterium sp.]|uniref:M23 family metallopeptidase n=1 Tax=uncultured Methylobacterium sp. TaxID=157278 RepID=UPI0025953C95
TREYYINDAGAQVDVLARSAFLRYREALGETVTIPDGLYPGDYLVPVGEALKAQYVSAYAHNGEIDVRPGEKVKRGQTIAKSGASGNVTSPQLHFEIRKGATPVDPMPHLASN